MTLEEIIKYCENVADYDCFSDAQRKCSEEHRRIAEWLKEIMKPNRENVKPELTPGKWIPKHSKYCRTWECSKCGYRVDLEDGGIYNFCSACGEKKG